MVGTQHADEATTELLEILAHRRRRYALQCLRDYDTPLLLADLADEVAVREYDAPLTAIDAENVNRIYVSLYHTHVPKLVDYGYVQFDQERDSVSLADDRESFERLRAVLETETYLTN